jgi:penicillin-binding protein 1A
MSDSNYTEEGLNDSVSNPDSHGRSEKNPVPIKTRARRVVAGMVVLTLLGIAVIGGYMWILTDDLPSLQQLENPELQLATIVYTADNKEMARFRHENRTWAPYDEIASPVVNALVATEDHRFYSHWGVDLFRTMTIPYHLLRLDPQGASTITQQLARNLYKQIGSRVSLNRKLKEILTAVQIERNYTKDEILEMYLNTVTFGNQSYGIESAADTYFSTTADSLTLLQGATLIGMLKATSYYNPRRHPDRAKTRRNTVLNQMLVNDYISRERYERLIAKPVELEFNQGGANARLAPYFAERVRLRLREWMEETGHNIYTDGLVVHTTLDSRLQEMAERAVAHNAQGLQDVVDVNWARPQVLAPDYAQLRQPSPRYNHSSFKEEHPDLEPFAYYWDQHRNQFDQFIRETDRFERMTGAGMDPSNTLRQLKNDTSFVDSLKTTKSRIQAGFVALDPGSGDVKAWVGGRDFAEDKYDHVSIARRQPGSTFKPFVYTAAIDNGYSPYYKMRDDTVRLTDPYTGKVWQPQNFSGSVTDSLWTLRDGLRTSRNTVTAGLVKEIGAERVVNYARQMGIDSPLNPVPSIALGTSRVTLLEMASAYGTLANRGLRSEPRLITRIEDRHGNVLANFPPRRDVALSEQTAYTMVDMMRGTIAEGGTGYRIRFQFEVTHDVAGKTGTTQNSADGWFMLMHPHLVTGAWVGFNDQRVAFRTNFWGQGAHNALLLVGDFMRETIDSPDFSLPNTAFVPPSDYESPDPNPSASPELEMRRVSTDSDDSRSEW